MTDMTFGDQTFLSLLKESDFDYEAVYPVVDAIVRPFVFRRLKGREDLCQDLLQEIHVKVWQNLPQFCQRAVDYTPQQRLGWLYAVAASKLNDTFRAIAQEERYWQSTETQLFGETVDDPQERILQEAGQQELEERVDALLRAACAVRSSPENTLAFLYNRVIAPLESGHAKKGDNKKIEAELRGQSLEKIRRRLSGDLAEVLGREIPEDVLQPLDERLRERKDVPFCLSAREIASGSYNVSSALTRRQMLQSTAESLAQEPADYGRNKFFNISLIICGLLRFI